MGIIVQFHAYCARSNNKKKHCLEYVLNTRNDLTGPKEKYDLHSYLCKKK